MATRSFRSAIYLGGGCRFGAAREGALKMVESTSGRVRTFPETFLGLRHGPMSAVQADTLVVCFLDADPVRRAYELDLIDELNRKGLGMGRVVVGNCVPREILRQNDLAISVPEMSAMGDDFMPVIDVLVSQLLAFFRCLAEGLSPDAPSESGVISRVVPGFRLHGAARDPA
jgi:tagatose-6-phosphate ketose/aldose isomerase